MRAHAAHAVLAPPAASLPSSSSSSALGQLKQRLHAFLLDNRQQLFTRQHRDGVNKRNFSLVGSFMVGTGTTNVLFLGNVRKAVPGFIQHPTKNTGVYVTSVDIQLARGKISTGAWQAYQLARQMIELFDPQYAGGDYVVQFAYMNDGALHYVKCHKDPNDISPQSTSESRTRNVHPAPAPAGCLLARRL